jgi:cyclophilin family peptidyl-prolyl cis-trans isomerase
VRAALLLAALLAPRAPAAAAEPPRVVLETTLGDLVLALRPDAAPRQVERFLALVRAGAYDSVPVARVDRTRYVRFAPVTRRRLTLSPEQRALAVAPRPPIEGALKNDYGTVTVVRGRDDVDATGTGLALILAPMPAMDGRFTSFAVVERGQETLEALREAPCDPDHAPLRAIEISRAYVLDAAAASSLALSRPPPGAAALLGPGVAALALGLLALLLRPRRPAARAGARLAVLLGFFGVLVAAAGRARGSAWLGTLLLAGAVAVFWLMTSFELPPAPDAAPKGGRRRV